MDLVLQKPLLQVPNWCCRFVRWSDGSLQLMIGDEVLDVAELDIEKDNNFLFLRHMQAAYLEVSHLPRCTTASQASVGQESGLLRILLMPQCKERPTPDDQTLLGGHEKSTSLY